MYGWIYTTEAVLMSAKAAWAALKLLAAIAHYGSKR